jgi:hypothetical protein
MTTSAKRATRTTINRAVQAADHGVSTTIEPSPWMSLESALIVALQLLDSDATAGRTTAYVTDGVLYVGPRKQPATRTG